MTMQIPFRSNFKLPCILLHHCVGSKYSHSHSSHLITWSKQSDRIIQLNTCTQIQSVTYLSDRLFKTHKIPPSPSSMLFVKAVILVVAAIVLNDSTNIIFDRYSNIETGEGGGVTYEFYTFAFRSIFYG